MRQTINRLLIAMLQAGAFVAHPAWAVEPTRLDPAEGYEPGTINVDTEVTHNHESGHKAGKTCGKHNRKGSQTTPETTVEYEWTDKLMTGVTLPVDIEQHESTHVGNASAHVAYTFNPDAEHAPVVAVTGTIEAPTAKHAEGLGGEVALRLAQKLGGTDSKHQVHAQIAEEYANDAEHGERHGRLAALAGYSYQATPATRLVADITHAQTGSRHEDSNTLELGVKHDIGKNATFVLGGGPGLGHDSPDWQVHAGLGIHFNLFPTK